MKLRFYRFMESVFSIPSAFFGDLADAVDADLHMRLARAMFEVNKRILMEVGGRLRTTDKTRKGDQ